MEEDATGYVGGGREPLIELESEEDGPELVTKQGAAGCRRCRRRPSREEASMEEEANGCFSGSDK